MPLDYDQLLELAQLDDELAHLAETFERNVPRRHIQELEVVKKDLVFQLARVQGALGELDEESTELSSEAKLHEGKLRELNASESAGKGVSYRNVEAVVHEIDLIKTRLDEIEFRQLEIMENFEELSGEQEDLSKQIADVDDALNAARSNFEVDQIRFEEERKRLAAQRDPLASALPADFVDMYDRLRSFKVGRAFAYVDQGNCGGCRVKVSALEISRIKQAVGSSPRELPRCEECDRILLLPSLKSH